MTPPMKSSNKPESMPVRVGILIPALGSFTSVGVGDSALVDTGLVGVGVLTTLGEEGADTVIVALHSFRVRQWSPLSRISK